MDNFDLLTKNNLSYILANEEKFGTQFIHQILEYCQRKKYPVDSIKKCFCSWEIEQNTFNFQVENNEIKISKREWAKKAKSNGDILIIVSVLAIIIFGIWKIVMPIEYDLEWLYILATLPFLITILLAIILRISKENLKYKQRRELKILKSSKVKIFEKEFIVFEEELKTVNVFWTVDSEAGSIPSALLVLTSKSKNIVLVNASNYLELLTLGNEIAKFLSKKLHIFHGKFSSKDRIQL